MGAEFLERLMAFQSGEHTRSPFTMQHRGDAHGMERPAARWSGPRRPAPQRTAGVAFGAPSTHHRSTWPSPGRNGNSRQPQNRGRAWAVRRRKFSSQSFLFLRLRHQRAKMVVVINPSEGKPFMNSLSGISPLSCGLGSSGEERVSSSRRRREGRDRGGAQADAGPADGVLRAQHRTDPAPPSASVGRYRFGGDCGTGA
jgi:hypothetical protein